MFNIMNTYLQDISLILIGSENQVTLSSGNIQRYALSLETDDAFTLEHFCVTTNAGSLWLQVDYLNGESLSVRLWL